MKEIRASISIALHPAATYRFYTNTASPHTSDVSYIKPAENNTGMTLTLVNHDSTHFIIWFIFCLISNILLWYLLSLDIHNNLVIIHMLCNYIVKHAVGYETNQCMIIDDNEQINHKGISHTSSILTCKLIYHWLNLLETIAALHELKVQQASKHR